MSVNSFNGWDFMELACKWEIFNMVTINDQGEAIKKYQRPDHLDESKPIRTFLEDLCVQHMTQGSRVATSGTSHCYEDDDSILQPYASDIRMYVRKLALDDQSYYQPLWRGLSRIEDDFTIVRATILLLPIMWS